MEEVVLAEPWPHFIPFDIFKTVMSSQTHAVRYQPRCQPAVRYGFHRPLETCIELGSPAYWKVIAEVSLRSLTCVRAKA